MVVALFYVEEDWRGWRAWNQFVKEQAALGITIDSDFQRLVPPAVPDDQNFAATPFWKHLFSPEYLGQTPDFQARKDSPTNAAYQSVDRVLKVGGLESSIYASSWADGTRMDAAEWMRRFHLQAFPDPKNTPKLGKVLILKYHLNRPPPFADFPVPGPTFPTPTNAGVLATNLLALTDRLGPVLAEFRDAAARPVCRFDLDYATEYPSTILCPHVFILEDVAQIMRMRCIAEIALHRVDDAASDVILALRLARATEEEPFLVSHMAEYSGVHPVLRTIWEGLERHAWSEDHLRKFENLLARIQLPPLLELCLVGEQTSANRLFDDLHRPPKPPIHDRPPSGAILTGCQGHLVKPPGFLCTGFSSFFPTGWAYFEQLNYNREMMEVRRVAWDREHETFSPSRFNREDGRVQFFPVPNLRAILEHRYLPWCFLFELRCANAKKTAYSQTGVNLGRVACALERFRLARGGYPPSLEALTPDWIKSIPKDIINGGPLHYFRSNTDSYRLYSVGWNERDDGGEIAYLLPPGLRNPNRPAPPDIDNGDWVWAIPGRQTKP